MANPSRPPTFKDYGSDGHCLGCGRKLSYDDPGGLWFRGFPLPSGCFGVCCKPGGILTERRAR